MTLEDKLNHYINYSVNKHNSQYVYSNEELNAINELKNNSIYYDLLSNIDNVTTYEEKKKIVNEFIDKEKEKKEEEKDLISKVYGIDITDIDHKLLNNGKEIYAFYDKKLNRKRILCNDDSQSLVSTLKEKQNDNEKYQTDKYEDNTYNILNDMSYENKNELNMVYINDIFDKGNQNLIANLSKEELNSLKSLLKKAEGLNLTYINIDNQLALDKDGNIYESYYDVKKGESTTETPESYSYNEDVMDNIDAINGFDENDELYDSKPEEELSADVEELNSEIKENYLNEYEDMKELITAEYKTYYVNVNIDVNAVFNKIYRYYKHPEELDNLVGNEKDFYEKLTTIFAEKIDERKKLENNSKNQLTLTDKGISAPFLITIVSILFLIIILLIKKIAS